MELVQAAQAAEHDVAAWQAAVAAGEALLAPEFAATPGIDWSAVRASLASSYTSLCIACENAGSLEASLAATDRAIALQPDEAMWRRNRVGTLIDLGRYAEAAEELARARAIEPDAARLAELEARLKASGEEGVGSEVGNLWAFAPWCEVSGERRVMSGEEQAHGLSRIGTGTHGFACLLL